MINININKVQTKQVVIRLEFIGNYYKLDYEEAIDLAKEYRVLSKRNELLDEKISSDRNAIADIFNRYFAKKYDLQEVKVTYTDDYALPDSMLSAYRNNYRKDIVFTKFRPFYISLNKYLKHYEKIKGFIENGIIKITDVS